VIVQGKSFEYLAISHKSSAVRK